MTCDGHHHGFDPRHARVDRHEALVDVDSVGHDGQVKDRRSAAVIAYVSGRPQAWPHTNADAVRTQFGDDADSLLTYAERVVDEFFLVVPHFATESMSEVLGRAKRDIRDRHPELTDEAVQQLSRLLSYNYR